MPDDLSHGSGDALADRRADYAKVLARSGDHAAAADLMRQALERAPAWAAGWTMLGLWLDEAGNAAAAAVALEEARRLDPADRFGAGLKLAAMGLAPLPGAAPPAFVRALFDQYAPRFESSLVDGLDYRGPDQLMAGIAAVAGARNRRPNPAAEDRRGIFVAGEAPSGADAAHRRASATTSGGGKSRRDDPQGSVPGSKPRFSAALDLGCGTGLMGTRLRPIVDRLDGVDLSPAMLAEARRKGIYDDLVEADIGALDLARRGYDLAAAADVLSYLGDLAPVFGRIASHLAPGGLLAFTLETSDGPEPYRLGESLRYAHFRPFVEAQLRSAGFTLRTCTDVVLRRDRGAPVAAHAMVAERGAADATDGDGRANG